MRKKKYRQIGVHSIFSIGCGFIITVFLGMFIFDYNSFRKRYTGYSYDDLKSVSTVIDDVESYSFMNSNELDSVLLDSMQYLKVNCFTLKHSSDLDKFIKSLSDTVLNDKDKRYMRGQISNELLLWDNERLVNTWCLTPRDFAQINRSDTVDYWEEFRANFGNYGHHHYSRPIFNHSKTLCVIEYSWQADWLAGSGGIQLYKKVNGKWQLLKEMNLWIS
ncbi:hypothetical protein [Aureibacter tunicatorum]|uniref:Uncharacterized protein n=1 Tax=Aureibacter tunicatorum TaxID=866807 RepID=A0AAE3XP46_9BACT|nr:hypothetical protein [Aureibacter tunicatorum]MDR6241491.1 hypothetical protein [Aureibacter tunicatorum]BDD06666.1 hypothetical protein AUTU_41490 [Aureibacter tunicatorum]